MKVWHILTAGLAAGAVSWWLVPAPEAAEQRPEAPEKVSAVAVGNEDLSRWQAAIRDSADRWQAMRGALELARSIPAAERMSWLQEKRFLHPDPLVIEAFLSELGRLTFEENPAAFIAAGINQEELAERGDEANPRFRNYLHEMAVADPESVIALAAEMENDELRSACLKEAALVLADRDPEALFRLIPDIPQADPELLHALRTAARGDADRLLSVIDVSSDPWRRLLAAATFWVKAERNPLDALTWLGTQEHDGAVVSILASSDAIAWQGWQNKQQLMVVLAHVADQLPDGALAETGAGGTLFDCMARYAPEACLKMDLVRLGLSEESSALAKIPLLQRLGVAQPAVVADVYRNAVGLDAGVRRAIAMDWFRDAMGKKQDFPMELLQVMDAPVRAEIEALLERKKTPAPRVPPPTIAELLNRAAADPDSYGLSFPNEVRSGTRAGRQEAVAWARDLPDEQIRNVSARLIRTGWPPPEVADVVFSRALQLGVMPDKDIGRWTYDMSNRAFRDPGATAAALEMYPSGRPRNQALQNVALRWHEADPKGAALWVARLPEDDREIAADAIKRGEEWSTQH